MNDDKERLIRDYIALKQKVADLEAQIDAMKSEVFCAVSELIEQAGEKSLLFEGYELIPQHRKTYEYPPNIKQMEDELKAMKKEAERSGEARLKSETGYVVLKKAEK